jgi:hypothetical protein
LLLLLYKNKLEKQWQVRAPPLYLIVDVSHLSTTIPDEKLRHLDPEGGYEDPDEVSRSPKPKWLL